MQREIFNSMCELNILPINTLIKDHNSRTVNVIWLSFHQKNLTVIYTQLAVFLRKP